MVGKKVWVCSYCTSENSEDLLVCEFCEADRTNGETKTDCCSSGDAGLAGRAGDAGLAGRLSEKSREAEEAARWADRRLRRLKVELNELSFADVSTRRSQLRLLQLELHPDKQPPDKQQASQALFLLVQKEWELNEAARKRAQTSQRATQQTQETPVGSRSTRGPAAKKKPPPRQAAKPRPSEEQPSEEQLAPDFKEALKSFEAAQERSRRDEHLRRQIKAEKQKQQQQEEEDEEKKKEREAKPRKHILVEADGQHVQLGQHELELDSIVADVKQVIEEGTSLSWEQLRLTLGSRELGNDELLRDLCVSTNMRLRFWVIVVDEERCDYTWVWQRVRQSWMELQHASTAIRSDNNMLKLALGQDWRVLKYVPREIMNDRSLMILAVQHSGQALEILPEELRGDRELVFLAVRQTWKALRYASTQFRDDADLLLSAMWQDVAALEFASDRLRADRSFIEAAILEDALALQYGSTALRSDRELVKLAVGLKPEALRWASRGLASDPEFLGIVRGNAAALRYVDADARRKDEEALFDQAWFALRRS